MTSEKKDPGTHTKNTLFIRNIPESCTNQRLEETFSKYGPIRSAFVVPGKKVAFAHFAVGKDAQTALLSLSKGEIEVDGSKLNGEIALRKKSEKPAKRSSEDAKLDTEKTQAKQEGDNNKPANKKSKNTTTAPVKEKKLPLGPLVTITFDDGNIAKIDFDKKQLYKRVRKVGDIKELKFPTAIPNQATVLFKSATDAVEAVKKLDNHIFKKHKMTAVQSTESLVMKQHRLIIRNLPFTCTKDGLEKIISGNALEIIVPLKEGSKRAKGFAFVQMATRKEANDIMETFNGKELMGRMVAVDWAVSKESFVGADEHGKADQNTIKIEGEEAEAKQAQKIENIEPEQEKDDLDGTVFIRNVPFDVEEDDLKNVLLEYGKLDYCKIVTDPTTGTSKGSAFAKFSNAASAKACCLASAALSQEDLDSGVKDGEEEEDKLGKDLAQFSNKIAELAAKRTGKTFKSIVDTSKTLSNSGVVIADRALLIVPAVDRKKATSLKSTSFIDNGPQDRRNLYLLNESLIKTKTTAAEKFWTPADKAFRNDLLKDRKKELADPNLFVSNCRLSIRHLPTSVKEADLKSILKTACKRALLLGEDDEGYPILDSKVLDPVRSVPAILKQVKVVRSDDKRSKGFAFAQWTHPTHAMITARYLTRYQPGLWKELLSNSFRSRHQEKAGAFRPKAPLVEFATEKMSVINKRQVRLDRK